MKPSSESIAERSLLQAIASSLGYDDEADREVEKIFSKPPITEKLTLHAAAAAAAGVRPLSRFAPLKTETVPTSLTASSKRKFDEIMLRPLSPASIAAQAKMKAAFAARWAHMPVAGAPSSPHEVSLVFMLKDENTALAASKGL